VVDLRALADRLVAPTEGTGWTGRAADALTERIRDRAVHLVVDGEAPAADAAPHPVLRAELERLRQLGFLD
jgi:hypothetical protein